jgi:RecJ-like exonuclease
MIEQEHVLAEEIPCPYCKGTGGTWEFLIVKRNRKDIGSEIVEFVKCKGCRGLGKILTSAADAF